MIMTREEEIKQYCAEQGFPYGACSGISSIKAIIATEAIKWADKTMIEKAREWLSLNMKDVVYFGMNEDLYKPEFIQSFIKAMEEQS